MPKKTHLEQAGYSFETINYKKAHAAAAIAQAEALATIATELQALRIFMQAEKVYSATAKGMHPYASEHGVDHG